MTPPVVSETIPQMPWHHTLAHCHPSMTVTDRGRSRRPRCGGSPAFGLPDSADIREKGERKGPGLYQSRMKRECKAGDTNRNAQIG
ncbi:hypothetical protein ColTof3_12651 [Colletotrichum tofieldiae]|nr:hypothetical protein ColTof3_12651 [Colletotrichum tofieldiae]